LEGVNRFDLTIVVSKFLKDVFEKLKYTQYNRATNQPVGELVLQKPISVLFEGEDPEIFKPIIEFPDIPLVRFLDSIEEDFCYLYVGHWLQGDLGHDRKDTGMMLKTFIETFKNKQKDVALIMKSSQGSYSCVDQANMIERINALKGDSEKPNIYLVHGELTNEELNILYNHPKVKTMITTTHGEGFGRPLLEFCFVGKPIIAPN